MLCTRCGKRPAVVFVSNNNSKDAPTAGYCLTCAKELGIKPVEDLISKMGISDEDLENVQDQMNTLMNSMGDGDMSQLMEQLGADNLAEQMGDFSKDGDGSEDDDFSHGAPAFPAFFNSMFGGQNNNATNQDNNKKGKKDIMKIECPIDFMDLDILGFIDHNITVNIIEDGKIISKKPLKLPREIKNIIRCKNPRCITSIEQGLDHIFVLTDEENQVYRCKYCEEKYQRN